MTSATKFISFCQHSRFIMSRGKPSTRNLSPPLLVIAFLNSRTVTSAGTIFPSRMKVLIISARGEPDSLSARSKSPALKWINPKSFTILAQLVPLPLPGPPRTKTTYIFEFLNNNEAKCRMLHTFELLV